MLYEQTSHATSSIDSTELENQRNGFLVNKTMPSPYESSHSLDFKKIQDNDNLNESFIPTSDKVGSSTKHGKQKSKHVSTQCVCITCFITCVLVLCGVAGMICYFRFYGHPQLLETLKAEVASRIMGKDDIKKCPSTTQQDVSKVTSASPENNQPSTETYLSLGADVGLDTKADQSGNKVPWEYDAMDSEGTERKITLENNTFLIPKSGFYGIQVSLTFLLLGKDQTNGIQIVVCTNVVKKANERAPPLSICQYQMVLPGGKTTVSQNIPRRYLKEGDRLSVATNHLNDLYISDADNRFRIYYLNMYHQS